jgi:hypothetical protein
VVWLHWGQSSNVYSPLPTMPIFKSGKFSVFFEVFVFQQYTTLKSRYWLSCFTYSQPTVVKMLLSFCHHNF